jgi:hypothetical protein
MSLEDRKGQDKLKEQAYALKVKQLKEKTSPSTTNKAGNFVSKIQKKILKI